MNRYALLSVRALSVVCLCVFVPFSSLSFPSRQIYIYNNRTIAERQVAKEKLYKKVRGGGGVVGMLHTKQNRSYLSTYLHTYTHTYTPPA